MHKKGQLVFGYVVCNDGLDDPKNVENDIKNWHVYHPQIDGIYLDEGPTSSDPTTDAKIQQNYNLTVSIFKIHGIGVS